MSVLFLFLILAVLVLLEVPVAFAMTLSAIFFLVLDGTTSVQIVVQRLAPSLDSFPLLAIPMFVLAGNVLNKTGVAERIFEFALALVGHIRGSLAHVNVLASIIFSGMSGVAAADAAGLGMIEMRAMEREGFAKGFSAAVTGASSIIGPIIPPSTIMVMYAVQVGAPLSAMFLAGVVPGLLMGLVLMVTIYIMCFTGAVVVPARPRSSWPHIRKTFMVALPGLLAPVVLVAGLLAGVATPTELGGVIVLYAVLLGLFNRELDSRKIWDCMVDTFVSCGVIVFVIAASAPFAWIMAVWNLPQDLANSMMSLTANKFVLLAILNAGLLFLGCFLETAALLLISVPVLAPLLQQMGVDPVHFGIIIILNLMIGANSPPFGVILFVMIDVAKVPFSRYIRSFMPFYIPQVLLLILITSLPALSLWLPQVVEGDSFRSAAALPISERKATSPKFSTDGQYAGVAHYPSEESAPSSQPNDLLSTNNSKNQRVRPLHSTHGGAVESSALYSWIRANNTHPNLPADSDSDDLVDLQQSGILVEKAAAQLTRRGSQPWR
jgi:tripartite ATP-independent transporter DctM subunit